MAEQDVVDINELERFCHQFDCHSQFISARGFRAGSFAEIQHHEMSMVRFGLNFDKQDTDSMTYFTEEYAFPCGQVIPSQYRGSVYWIYTNGVHPGYARLFRFDGPIGVARSHFSYFFDFTEHPNHTRHGPALHMNHQL